MKIVSIIAAVIIAASLSSCSDQSRARKFGGTVKIDLPAHTKLVNAAWKESHLWLLTRPMHADETADTFEFTERSSWGILNGTVVIKETK